MTNMRNNTIEEMKEFYTNGNDNIELYINNYNNGTTVLSIHVENNENPENIGLGFKKFIENKLLKVLKERRLIIIGIYDTISSFTWCNVKFYIDTVENANKYKNELIDLENELIDYGNITINTGMREFNIFDYDKAKSEYTNLLLKMLSKGYELSVKSNNDFLDCSDDRIKEVINNKEYRKL